LVDSGSATGRKKEEKKKKGSFQAAGLVFIPWGGPWITEIFTDQKIK